MFHLRRRQYRKATLYQNKINKLKSKPVAILLNSTLFNLKMKWLYKVTFSQEKYACSKSSRVIRSHESNSKDNKLILKVRWFIKKSLKWKFKIISNKIWLKKYSNLQVWYKDCSKNSNRMNVWLYSSQNQRNRNFRLLIFWKISLQK